MCHYINVASFQLPSVQSSRLETGFGNHSFFVGGGLLVFVKANSPQNTVQNKNHTNVMHFVSRVMSEQSRHFTYFY